MLFYPCLDFRLDDPVGGEHMNIMKVGLETCHRIVAVSTGYAWECETQDGGWGLHQIVGANKWKLKGIVNGMDYSEWSPESDKHLQVGGRMPAGKRKSVVDGLCETTSFTSKRDK